MGRRGRGWVEFAVPAPLLKKSDVYIIVVVVYIVVYIVIVYLIYKAYT